MTSQTTRNRKIYALPGRDPFPRTILNESKVNVYTSCNVLAPGLACTLDAEEMEDSFQLAKHLFKPVKWRKAGYIARRVLRPIAVHHNRRLPIFCVWFMQVMLQGATPSIVWDEVLSKHACYLLRTWFTTLWVTFTRLPLESDDENLLSSENYMLMRYLIQHILRKQEKECVWRNYEGLLLEVIAILHEVPNIGIQRVEAWAAPASPMKVLTDAGPCERLYVSSDMMSNDNMSERLLRQWCQEKKSPLVKAAFVSDIEATYVPRALLLMPSSNEEQHIITYSKGRWLHPNVGGAAPLPHILRTIICKPKEEDFSPTTVSTSFSSTTSDTCIPEPQDADMGDVFMKTRILGILFQRVI